MKKIEYPSEKRVPFFTFTESLRRGLEAQWGRIKGKVRFRVIRTD